MVGSWVNPPSFSSPHFEHSCYMKISPTPLIFLSYVKNLAQAYCFDISYSFPYHSYYPHYATHVLM